MARILDELPKNKAWGGGRSEKYPFDEWFDGNVYLAIEGEDFSCKRQSFESAVRTAARRRGIKVAVRQHPEGVAIQASGDGQDAFVADTAEAVSAY